AATPRRGWFRVRRGIEMPAGGPTIASASLPWPRAARMPSASSGATRSPWTSFPGQRAASRAPADATTRHAVVGSSAGTEALRVVERGRSGDRLATVDLYAIRERRPALPAEHERFPEQRRGPPPGHVAAHPA